MIIFSGLSQACSVCNAFLYSQLTLFHLICLKNAFLRILSHYLSITVLLLWIFLSLKDLNLWNRVGKVTFPANQYPVSSIFSRRPKTEIGHLISLIPHNNHVICICILYVYYIGINCQVTCQSLMKMKMHHFLQPRKTKKMEDCLKSKCLKPEAIKK